MGKTISLYLSDEALEKLDDAVAFQAKADTEAGATGRAVASRSSFVEKLINDYANKPAALTREQITYAVVSLAEEYGAKEVSLFGSYARGDATPESDVDLLLEKGEIKGLQVLDFQERLADELGCSVDVVTTEGASDRFLKRIKEDMVVLYAAI